MPQEPLVKPSEVEKAVIRRLEEMGIEPELGTKIYICPTCKTILVMEPKKAAAVRKIPLATFRRWEALLKVWNQGVESRLLYLIESDVKEHWTDEMEQQFKKMYGLEE